MTRYCSNCGERAEEDDRFCHYCGERLPERSTDQRRTERDHSDERHRTGNDHSQERRRTAQPDEERQYQLEGSGAGPEIQRLDAVSTLGQSLRWLLGFPMLIAAFLIVDLFDSLQFFVSPALSVAFQIVSALLSLVLGGVAYIYVDREIRDEIVEFGDAVREVLGQLVSLVGVFLVYVVVVAIGFLLLILPGVYLGARLVLAFPACVLDKKGVSDSLSTSWEVADGNVLKLVGIFLLGLLPVFGVFIIAAATGGPESIENPVFYVLGAPLFAIVSGMYEMATARVYLENR